MNNKNETYLVAIPMRGHLFLFKELEKMNIAFDFFHYDYFQTPEPKAVCKYHGKEYWGNKMLFLKSELTQEKVFSLLEKVENKKNITF